MTIPITSSSFVVNNGVDTSDSGSNSSGSSKTSVIVIGIVVPIVALSKIMIYVSCHSLNGGGLLHPSEEVE